jgi:cytochrome c oxidase subunit II
MPPVRARLLTLACLLGLAALTYSGIALGGNGGFAPAGPDTPSAERINSIYWFVFGFAAFIFLVVEIALVLFIVRYRNRGRPRDAEGPQVRGHLNLELAWTAVPVLILAAIAVFTFYKLPGIKDVPAAGAAGSQMRVDVEGRQFYWQFTYPNGVVAIDTLHLPVNRPVRLEVSSPDGDVIHSWWIPALGGKIDAIPGHPNHTWYQIQRPGTYVGQCAEFCGIQHAAMTATVVGVPAAEFDSWLSGQARAQAAGTSDLGAQEFEGVCAKCHGDNGQGGIGPNIANSAIIQNKDSLETIVRNGKNLMPPVGSNWSQRQMDALYSYVQKRYGHGG